MGAGFPSGALKFCGVGSERQIDPGFGFVIGVLIILGEPFADFGGGRADYRIEIRVIVRIPSEDLDSQGPFLQFPRMSIQRALHDIAQQGWDIACCS